MPEIKPIQQNPLQKYFRQPKIYVPLPSRGKYYPSTSIDIPETGDFPIYPMTARDEIMMKTPDSLVNGETTVQVIQSCVPNIKNAWDVPSIDLDTILIAIRIASYGEKMEVDINVPVTGEERKYDLNLVQMLDSIGGVEYNNVIQVDGLTVYLRPLTYRDFTQTSLKTFEEQKIFNVLNNDTIGTEEKLQKFNQSFRKLTDLTILTLEKSIQRISGEGFEVTDQNHISEFVDNADKALFRSIIDHIEAEKNKSNIKPLKIKATQEDIEKGVPETYEVPLAFDSSVFFG